VFLAGSGTNVFFRNPGGLARRIRADIAAADGFSAGLAFDFSCDIKRSEERAMTYKTKASVMDAAKIKRVISRMGTEILERNRNLNNLVIIGIPTRGVAVAKRIAKVIKDMDRVDIPLGIIDITRYRDDYAASSTRATSSKSKIPFSIDKKDIILVDDVLFTGRTIRAAMDGLFDLGRPKSIQLLALIDRGHRELPIRADYVGKVLPTARREIVRVDLREIDERDDVLITEPVTLTKKR
jgi:pyrimidine operon attenuation protein/uracil phosphoribosyltransferase